MQPFASSGPALASVVVLDAALVGVPEAQPARAAPISAALSSAAANRRWGLGFTGWLLDRSDSGGFGASELGRPGEVPVRARPSLAVPNAAGRRPTHRWQVFGLSGPLHELVEIPTGHRFP